jgi:hypothetical protein
MFPSGTWQSVEEENKKGVVGTARVDSVQHGTSDCCPQRTTAMKVGFYRIALLLAFTSAWVFHSIAVAMTSFRPDDVGHAHAHRAVSKQTQYLYRNNVREDGRCRNAGCFFLRSTTRTGMSVYIRDVRSLLLPMTTKTSSDGNIWDSLLTIAGIRFLNSIAVIDFFRILTSLSTI